MHTDRLVSIIVCTHNRAEVLKDALSSLSDLIMPEGYEVEIVLVDNASSDGTSAQIEAFGRETEKFQITHLHEEKLGKTFALNRGIGAARGALLTFVDDDHIVSENYLISVIRAAEEHGDFNIFCGRVLPDWDGSEPQWVHDDIRYPIRPYPVPRFDLGEKTIEVREDKSFLPGSGNLAVKQEVFERIGVFSEELGPKGHNLSGGEDIEFVRRALRRGERILYNPQMRQQHQVFPENLKLPYIVKKAYLRSIAAYEHSGRDFSVKGNHPVPGYLIRQAITRLLRAALSLDPDARRYYLVRFASTMGEIKGRRKALSGPLLHNSG
jgi:glycosyltransferase involved in cell wall biosynthesis